MAFKWDIRGQFRWKDGSALESATLRVEIRTKKDGIVRRTVKIANGHLAFALVVKNKTVRKLDLVTLSLSSNRRSLGIVSPPRTVDALRNFSVRVFPRTLIPFLRYPDGAPVSGADIWIRDGRTLGDRIVRRTRTGSDGRFSLPYPAKPPPSGFRRIDASIVDAAGRRHRLTIARGHTVYGIPPESLDLTVTKREIFVPVRARWLDGSVPDDCRLSLHEANGRRIAAVTLQRGAGVFRLPGGWPGVDRGFEIHATVPGQKVRVAEPRIRGGSLRHVVEIELIHEDDEELLALPHNVPIAFFPVRVETRFRLDEAKPQLHVKIIPDPIQVTAHDPRLSRHEQSLKTQYEAKVAAADIEGADAFEWLSKQVGIPRALHIASSKQRRAARSVDRVPRAHLLPKRWYVYLRARDGSVTAHPSGPVAASVKHGLPMAPVPGEVKADSLDDLINQYGAEWLRSFDAAEKVGMGVRIHLDEDLATRLRARKTSLDVTVIGVSDLSPTQASRQLDDLLSAHRLDQGFELLDPDTPTNLTAADNVSRRPTARDWWRVLQAGDDVPTPDTVSGNISHALGLPSKVTVFDRTPRDHLEHHRVGDHALRAIWPATIGYMLEKLLERTGADVAAGDWLKDWAVSYLRADGALPMFRIGDQPYGIVVVSGRSSGEVAGSGRAMLQSILARLRETYWEKAELVRIGSKSGNAELQDLLDVLAIEPGPAVFSTRQAYNWRARHLAALFVLQAMFSEEDNPNHASMWSALKSAETAAEQLGALNTNTPKLVADAIESHAARVAMIDALNVGVPTAYRPPVYKDPPLFHYFFNKDEEEVQAPGSGDDVIEWLEKLARTDGPPYPKTPGGVTARLLRRSLARNDTSDLRSAFGQLAAWARQTPEPAKWLDRLIGRHLGLAGHRLDAWISGMAYEELDGLRKDRRTGVQVGAMGWVENLQPTTGKEANGYILAPSLATATTAAVLRNAWESFGSGTAYSLAAVDLSSRRVRRALWILDGVRSGLTIAEVMGAQLEQSLHRAGASAAVPALRTAIAGTRDATALKTIDGELCARAWEDPPADEVAKDHQKKLKEAIGKLPAPIRGTTRDALKAVAEDFDAVADLLLAEGVHLVTQGREDRLSAWLSSQRSGESPPPTISIAEKPPASRVEIHRLVVLCPLGPSSARGWAADDLANTHPALEGFARTILGDADDYAVEHADGPVKLSRLEISALSAVRAAARSSDEFGTGLVERMVRTFGPLPTPGTVDATQPPLHEVATLARMMSTVMSLGRPLDPEWPPPDGAPTAATDRTVLGMLEGNQPLPNSDLLAGPTSFRQSENADELDQVFTWLTDVGRINEDVGLLVRLINATEAMQNRAIWRMAQLRFGRTEESVDTVVWNGAPIGRGKIAGFILAEWAERLPAPTTTAGAAIKFDGPQARAPQAMILALPNGPWHRASLLGVADEVRALAKLRTVGPEHLGGTGQMLPASIMTGEKI